MRAWLASFAGEAWEARRTKRPLGVRIWRATIMAGDHIVAVDDVDVSELPFDDCIDLLAPAEDADDED